MKQDIITKETESGITVEILHDGKLAWVDTFETAKKADWFINMLRMKDRHGRPPYATLEEAKQKLEEGSPDEIDILYRDPSGYRFASITNNEAKRGKKGSGYTVFFLEWFEFMDAPTLEGACEIIRKVEQGHLSILEKMMGRMKLQTELRGKLKVEKVLYQKLSHKRLKRRVLNKKANRLLEYIRREKSRFEHFAFQFSWKNDPKLLPANIYLKDSRLWGNLGNKRILLFQTNKNHKRNWDNTIIMTIEDKPLVLGTNKGKARIALDANDLETLKRFVQKNQRELRQFDSRKSDAEIQPFFEKTGIKRFVWLRA